VGELSPGAGALLHAVANEIKKRPACSTRVRLDASDAGPQNAK
jgi:hypothetical protein